MSPIKTRPAPCLARWAHGAGAALLLSLTFSFSGCALLRSPMSEAAEAAAAPPPAASPIDPWERFNRQVFSFNDRLDRGVFIPLAKAYKTVMPGFLTESLDNMFSNVGDIWSAVNHLLQGKPQQAMEHGLRFGVNSFFGAAGIFDVATEMGLERQWEDFGQTLGRWGFGTGPYLVLPLLGPSNVRDGLALPLDRVTSFSSLVGEGYNRYSVAAIELIHNRASLLNASSVLNQVALDRYTFVRDSYLARRRNSVYDGNPPSEPDDEAPVPAKKPTP
jgi:phospholipid-binding lipoprotein MlaA